MRSSEIWVDSYNYVEDHVTFVWLAFATFLTKLKHSEFSESMHYNETCLPFCISTQVSGLV